MHLVDPQPYLEFNYLVENARAVITDSGGITEGSAWIKDANGVWSQFSWQF